MPPPARRVYDGRQAGAQKHEKFLELIKDVQFEKMTNAICYYILSAHPSAAPEAKFRKIIFFSQKWSAIAIEMNGKCNNKKSSDIEVFQMAEIKAE